MTRLKARICQDPNHLSKLQLKRGPNISVTEKEPLQRKRWEILKGIDNNHPFKHKKLSLHLSRPPTKLHPWIFPNGIG